MLDEELPHPTNSGKRIRTLNLLRRLAKSHDITYLAHRNQDSDEAHAADEYLRSLGIHPVVVERSVPPKSGATFYARLAANLFSDLPYSVTSHCSPEFTAKLRELHARQRFDLLHCEWTPYLETARGFVDSPIVVTAHNIESQIWQRYFETEANWLKRWYIGKQWKKFEAFERWAFQFAREVVTVSQDDAQLAQSNFGATRVSVVENGVDLDFFKTQFDRRDPRHLLILGSLDWRPNIDGIEQFLKNAFPRLLELDASIRLSIVGRNPSPSFAEWIRKHPQVELHANVPDVRSHLQSAGMLVVPLRVGGGSRLKILEAAASGLPIVSTVIGAEGLELQPVQHLLSASSIGEMVDPIFASIREYDRAVERARSANEVIRRTYNWDFLTAKLEKVWFGCAS